MILTEFGFRLRAAFVILSDALAESNCEAAPKAESKRLYAQNDRFIFFQSYSVTEPKKYFKRTYKSKFNLNTTKTAPADVSSASAFLFIYAPAYLR